MKTPYLNLLLLFLFACSPKSDNISLKQKEIDSLKQSLLDSIQNEELNILHKIDRRDVEKYKNLAESAFYQVLFQNTKLEGFRNKLYSDSIQGKKEVLEYLLNDYPIITYFVSNKEIVLRGTGYYKGFKSFKHFPQNFKENYTRYAWWNPNIEEYKSSLENFTYNPPPDSGSYQLITEKKDFSTPQGVQELAYALLIQEFKTNMKRDSKSLKKYYKLYKKAFFELIDKELYKNLNINMTVDRLLEAYPYYQKKKNKEWHKYMEIEDYGDYQTPEEKYEKKSKGRMLAGSRWHWYYGFWHRRQLEDNSETVKEILEEVQKHYQ